MLSLLRSINLVIVSLSLSSSTMSQSVLSVSNGRVLLPLYDKSPANHSSPVILLRFYKVLSVSAYILFTGFALDFVEMCFTKTNPIIYDHNLQDFIFKAARGTPLMKRTAVLFASVLQCMIVPFVLLMFRATLIHLLSYVVDIKFTPFKQRLFYWMLVTLYLFLLVLLNGLGVIDVYKGNPGIMHVQLYLMYAVCGVFL